MIDPAIDLATPQRIHVVGIGGSGMSAIAGVLASMGHTVSGSDVAESEVLQRLRRQGIDAGVGHDPARVAGADAVAVSSAIRARDPEVEAAVAQGIPVLRRAEILAAICATRRTVAVSGTHGKTTTSAMLALILAEAGMAPSWLIGGDLLGVGGGIGGGAAWGSGAWLVVEADESDGTFVELDAEAVVLTSVEPDHLDHHGSFEALRAGFGRFLSQAPGPRVVCADDPGAAELAGSVPCLTYGTSEGATWRMDGLDTGRDGVSFTLREGTGAADGTNGGVGIELPVPGLHNARNAAGAAVAAMALGAPAEAAARALAGFGGVGRRWQRRGEAGGVTVVEDYAHLPGEVAAALATAGQGGWGRVVCAFQPHRFTRTADLHRQFADAFVEADVLAVTDVYPAGQAPLPGVSGKLIVDAVLDAHPAQRVAWVPARRHLLAWLTATLRAGDLCLVLGAGDITTLPADLLAALEGR